MTRRVTDIVDEGEVLGVVAGALVSVPVPETAADLAFTPSGSIAATDVQAALVEIDTEKLSSVGIANLTATGTPSATTFLRGDNTWAVPAGGANANLLHVRDEKASGTSGGTATAGSWQTRTLNTVLTNEISGASLASNQITLPAGTYEADWWAEAYEVNEHRSQLYNITTAATLLLSKNSRAGSTDISTVPSMGRGRFTLAATSVLELQHRCTDTIATNGFGNASSLATEVYVDLMIRKIA